MKKQNADEFLNQLDEAIHGKRPRKKTQLNENEQITLKEFEDNYANPQVHTLEANRERWESLIEENFGQYTETKVDMFDNVVNAFIYHADKTEQNDIILKDAVESLQYYLINSDLKLEDNWNIFHADGTVEFGLQLKEDNDEFIPMIDVIPNVEQGEDEVQQSEELEESDSDEKDTQSNPSYTDLIDAMVQVHPSYKQFNSMKFNKIISNFFLEEGYLDDISMEYDQVTDAVDSYVNDEEISINELAKRVDEFYQEEFNNLEQYDFNESTDVVEDEDGDKVFYDYDRWYAELDRIHDQFDVDPVPNEQGSFEATTPDHDIIGKWYNGDYGKIFEPEVISENLIASKDGVDLIDLVSTIYHVNKELAGKKFGYIFNVIEDFLYDNGYIFDHENMTTEDLKKGIKKSFKHYDDEYGFAKELSDYYNKNRSLYESKHEEQKVEEDSDNLSDSESKKLDDKREEIVKDLKDQKEDFKKRYGDDWESVMYGTATNIAKKELGITEGKIQPKQYKMIAESKDGNKSYNVKASCKLMADVKSKKFCEKNGMKFKKMNKR